MVMDLTRDEFAEFKSPCSFFRPYTYTDVNGDVQEIIPDDPITTVRLMWNPETNRSVAEGYGRDLNDICYAVTYGRPDIRVGDVVTLDGCLWDVAGVKSYNTHDRIEAVRRRGQGTCRQG